ncbi:hypothetical protein, partial [Flavobacterium psychrophilum]|uniref:hypothetical protein n=4 Tax=Flavobacterium psychrophilum TaxID=96345 RepID=UPI001ABCB059
TISNKLTDTNNWGVKFFFPCMDKFTKIHSFKQVLIYLVELCNRHSSLKKLGFMAKFKVGFVFVKFSL